MNGDVRPGAAVLADTNVIIEAHRTGTWAALVGAYVVETVGDCVAETQTGYQARTREHWIDLGDLNASLGAVHQVTDREHAELAVRVGGIALDRGEESLWAHALGRTGTWFFCGRIGQASVRVSDSVYATGWSRWRNFWIERDTGRSAGCDRRTRGSGWPAL